MIEKSSILVICIHKRVKSIAFAVSIKLCDESGLAILKIIFKYIELFQMYIYKLGFNLCYGPVAANKIIQAYVNIAFTNQSTGLLHVMKLQTLVNNTQLFYVKHVYCYRIFYSF